jgi:hypothetical protein
MAGDGTRFGGTEFKPFIDGTEKLFIELAKEPFNEYRERYDMEFYFVVREDQEARFQVTSRLKQLFPTDRLHVCILPTATSGPAQTLANAVRLFHLSGSAFVCDCDHAINIQPMIQYIENNELPDILVPLLTIEESEQANFGKVTLDTEGNAIAFFEKEHVPFSDNYSVKGLVGCYLFKDVTLIQQFSHCANISDILPVCQQTNKLAFVTILEAGLFGTPESLIKYRFNLAKRMTFFVDIDGTLVYLPKHVSYDSKDAKLLPGAIEQLSKWKEQGHIIVLTTGREHARREKLIQMLHELHVPYDQLVTNLRPGPRILINDKKPYSELHQMARAIQIRRNQGIAHIEIHPTPEILTKCKGGSFANVYLIQKDGVRIVRKYIEKTKENQIHVDTLRRQYDDLKRIEYYRRGLTPKMLGFSENENEFYYDMEYLEHHKELSTFKSSVQEQIVQQVITTLTESVYCYSKQVDGQKWMNEFLEEKIYAKYTYIESLGPRFSDILNAGTHTINGTVCKGIRAFFSRDIFPEDLCPQTVSPIHGDLTLENILYNEETKDFRLIDTSGSRYVDNKAMDTSKLLQSFLAKYETWDTRTDIQEYTPGMPYILPTDVIEVSKELYTFIFHDNDAAYKSSVLMLACYLIRMIPFLVKKSEKHAVFGLMLATYYLSITEA